MLLTSHSMADVESLCPRLIVIDEGGMAFDGRQDELSSRFAPAKVLRLVIEGEDVDLSAYGDVLQRDGDQWLLRVDRAAVPATTARLLARFPVADLSVEDPSLENVMDQAFRGMRRTGSGAA